MALPRYLAMTRAEFTACSSPPELIAWMACHFSPYGTGLTNLPPDLPDYAMVILNDRIPMAGHDPDTVIRQLQELAPACLLLDFQRPPEREILEMVRQITTSLACPVGVPPAYAAEYSSPLFLPLPAPDVPVAEHLAPWQGREIWLELSMDAMSYAITEQGAQANPLPSIPKNGRHDPALFCHYRVAAEQNRAVIDLLRTREDLDNLLETAQAHGVTSAVGLWQEFVGTAKTP